MLGEPVAGRAVAAAGQPLLPGEVAGPRPSGVRAGETIKAERQSAARIEAEARTARQARP